ncbi:hypothetical protein [Luteibacter sp. SG786]|uniref:hypothetical protein n=1 Tax=Luteibacter sp. SG786 TaxID=2587130 RepID=UPI00141EE017|nr:hypothetical protein [Luteibacter sp. SG786]NII54355.1 hypothetical protein [Luteibacter sp. SG786]
MSKIRLTMTVVREYEPVVDHYEGETDIHKMAEIDRKGAEGDVFLFLEFADSVSVKTEVVE